MKNKILSVLFVFILLGFIFITSNVYAAEETELLIVDGYDMSDIYNYFNKDDAFFIFKTSISNNGKPYIYVPISGTTSEPSFIKNIVTSSVDNNEKVIAYVDQDNNILVDTHQFYRFEYDTLKFEKSYAGNLNGDINIDNMTILYSSKGIYNEDGTTFFLDPPAQSILGRVLEETKPYQMFQKQMKNVLVSLVVFLVGLVAFLKAWAWLKTQLRKA